MQDGTVADMATVQVRNVPEEIHRLLKIQAAESGTSLNEFLLGRLSEIAERPTLAQLAQRARARGPVEGVTMGDIVDLVRHDRDHR